MMNLNPSRFSAMGGALMLSISVLLLRLCELGFCREAPSIILGGFQDISPNSVEIESLARFAVQEYNNKQNTILEFTRVLKARQQVVAGMMYDLTLEAMDSGQKKVYEAKVWEQPWMNFKHLEEFKLSNDSPDLGFQRGWQAVPLPPYDTEVQDAANYAVKSFELKNNSWLSYELQDILLAKAKVIGDYVKFELLLKVRKGIEEEIFRVEMNKNTEGEYHLSQMEQVHS